MGSIQYQEGGGLMLQEGVSSSNYACLELRLQVIRVEGAGFWVVDVVDLALNEKF